MVAEEYPHYPAITAEPLASGTAFPKDYGDFNPETEQKAEAARTVEGYFSPRPFEQPRHRGGFLSRMRRLLLPATPPFDDPSHLSEETQKKFADLSQAMQHLEDGTARAVQFAREQYEQAVQALSNEVTGAQGRTGSQIKYIIEASRQQLETYEQTIREQEKGLDRLSPKQVSPVNPVTPIAARPGSFFSRLFRKQPATMEPAAYAQNQITETRRTIQEIDEEIAQAVKLCHLRETGIFQPGYHVTIKDPAFETGLKLEEMRQLGWGTRTQVGPDNQAPINQSYESWKANGKPRRS